MVETRPILPVYILFSLLMLACRLTTLPPTLIDINVVASETAAAITSANPSTPTPFPTSTPSNTPTPSATPLPSPTRTPTSTNTPSATPILRMEERLLFVQPDELGNRDIYIMLPDGSDIRRLTDAPSAEYMPSWSPDRLWIAFVSEMFGDPDIMLMKTDGSEVYQITTSIAADMYPAWSPDGREIVFASDRAEVDRFNLYIVEADCYTRQEGCEASVRRLTDTPYADVYPAWAPSERILFASNREGAVPFDFDIYMMEPDGDRVVRLTAGGGVDWTPAWSPDGRRIAYAAAPADSSFFDIFVLNIGSINPIQVTSGEGSHIFPVWSPHGDRLAYIWTHEGGRDICITRPNGSDLELITSEAQIESLAGWALVPVE